MIIQMDIFLNLIQIFIIVTQDMNNQEEFKEVIERYEYFLKEVNLLLYK